MYRVLYILSLDFSIFSEICRLELTNQFSLDIVVQGFVLKEPNGRKSYVKGKTIRWNVNSDDFTMEVLMDGLSADLRVGRDQSITVWYFNMIMAQDVRLTENDEFHVMFDMYRTERKLALAVLVLDNSCSETPVHVLDNIVHVPEPTIPDNDELLAGFQGCPPTKIATSHSTSPLKQPDPSSEAIETDPFDIVEEYVGVDDEYMYDVHLDVSTTCAEVGGNIQKEDDDGDVFAEHEEEEVTDIDPTGYSVVHDPENPDIRVGALFPDIVACRKAIRQRAIIVGYKLAKIKTDKTRFIAQCAHATCKWRIHASVLQDGKTAMVWAVNMFIIYLFICKICTSLM
jgi:hypothetical protein